MVDIAWVKVGELQKGKIFTVYSNETFDLKWYSDNVEWRNPIVIGQVSSIFFDRTFTCGFKAIVNHLGGTSYQGIAQSCGVTYSGVDFVNWGNQTIHNLNPNVDGGGWLYNNQRIYRGHIEGFRGFNYAIFCEPSKYNYYNTYGNIVVRIGDMVLDNTSIRGTQNGGKGGNWNTTMWTPYFSGNYSIALEGANIDRVAFNITHFSSSWETKSGILTIYANDSQGVGY